jgi:dihydrofolate reductase
MIVVWKLKENKQARGGKIKLFIASSLDGYIAREDDIIDWLYRDDDYGYAQFYNSVDTILMSTRTYDKVLEFRKN